MKKTKKKICIIIMFMLGLVVLCPIGLEYFIFRNNIYSVIENKDWASFLGSFIGGVIGGIGTLLAVFITVSETRDIQNSTEKKIMEDRRILKLKERKEFVDDIVTIIAKYITDISNYFYSGRIHEKLRKDLEGFYDELNNEKKKIKKLKLNKEYELNNEVYEMQKREIEEIDYQINLIKDKIIVKREEYNRFNVNRKIAVECYYLLNIKLDGIDSAVKLIEKLKYIHDWSTQYDKLNSDWINNNIEELKKYVREFIDEYTKVS